jgi:UDP-N-acetylglucosamine--N-acetylmuramyl-(pentapeptide) pyrophosphoryl-undecaprenol N-acetylglucosamine transferase
MCDKTLNVPSDMDAYRIDAVAGLTAPGGRERTVLEKRLPRNARLLLVASTGGHLAELLLLSDRLKSKRNSHWITFDNAQSQSLLADRFVSYVPYVAPRDALGVARAVKGILPYVRSNIYEGVVSTGAAVAVPALILARTFGLPA